MAEPGKFDFFDAAKGAVITAAVGTVALLLRLLLGRTVQAIDSKLAELTFATGKLRDENSELRADIVEVVGKLRDELSEVRAELAATREELAGVKVDISYLKAPLPRPTPLGPPE